MTRKMIFKPLLSVLLCAAMLLALPPTTVFAQGEDTAGEASTALPDTAADTGDTPEEPTDVDGTAEPGLGLAAPRDDGEAHPQAGTPQAAVPYESLALKVTGTAAYAEAYKVLAMVNAERAAVGKNALTMNAELMRAAMQRAAEQNVSFNHTRPDGSSWQTASSVLLNGSRAENIAIGYASAEAVMDGWMNSKGHRANILSENLNYYSIGIGAVRVDGDYHWVQLFSSSSATTPAQPADTETGWTVNATAAHMGTYSVAGWTADNPPTLTITKYRTPVLQLGLQIANANADLFSYYYRFPDSDLQITQTDPSVGTLTTGADGRTSFTPLKAGVTQVTVTSTVYPLLTQTLAVTVVDTRVKVAQITVSPAEKTLAPGAGAALIATVSPANADDRSVSWHSTNPAVATVNSNGRVTAVAAGRAEIIATANDGSGITGRSVVTVAVPVTGVALNLSSRVVRAGETLQLTATLSPANAADSALRWTTSNAAVAAVDANGLVTALKKGSATITVTTGNGHVARCTLTVRAANTPDPGRPADPNATITGVKLTQSSLRLAKGQKATVGAVIHWSDGSTTTAGLTWTSDNEKVATVDIDTGKITAAKNLKKNGKATITAEAENGVTATVKVTVLKSSAKAVKATKVSVRGVKKTLDVGKTAQLKVTVHPKNATNAAVTFASNKKDVLSVDATGKLTALKPGKAKLTVKAGGKKATITITVTAPVEGIEIEDAPKSLKVGEKVTLTASAVGAGQFPPKLSWRSSNKSIATVNSNGVVKAKKAGKVKITVKTDNGKKDTVTIAVKK